MFSDFQDHVIGVPQIAPQVTNNTFDGPGANEDFGREQVTGDPADRYKFRTSPLRNVAVQPTFMHNGAFTSLEDAVRHHLERGQSPRFTIARRAKTWLLISAGRWVQSILCWRASIRSWRRRLPSQVKSSTS